MLAFGGSEGCGVAKIRGCSLGGCQDYGVEKRQRGLLCQSVQAAQVCKDAYCANNDVPLLEVSQVGR